MLRVSRLAVVRVRGGVDTRGDVKDTLRMLNLSRPNQCTIVEDDPSTVGMLRKAKEKVTWGPVSSEVLAKLLEKRGEFCGGDSVTDEKVKNLTSYDTVADLSEAVCEGGASLSDIDGFNGVFRLRPPKKGYDSTKKAFQEGGSLGDRGDDINKLLVRMI